MNEPRLNSAVYPAGNRRECIKGEKEKESLLLALYLGRQVAKLRFSWTDVSDFGPSGLTIFANRFLGLRCVSPGCHIAGFQPEDLRTIDLSRFSCVVSILAQPTKLR